MKHALVYVLAYVAWAVATVGGLLGLFLLRAAFNQGYIIERMPKEAFHFIDRGALIVFGCLWLFGIVMLEGYFRSGAEQEDLGKRLLRVFGFLIPIGVVLYLIPPLMTFLKLI